MEGIITKGIGGFYYVEAAGCIYEAKARGIFRKDGITPLAGDRVIFEPTGNVVESGLPEARIDEILPRLNFFLRPPCANVETLVLVSAAKDPAPSFPVIDRFLAAAQLTGAGIVICVSKADLADEETVREFKDRYASIYPLIFVDGLSGSGTELLIKAIEGTQAALAGASGVGKSTLTNLLLRSGRSTVGSVSEKTLRGKNTTRHTELFRGDGFFLFDTPGFTSFDVEGVEPEDLCHCFPEFAPYLNKCRFRDCSHVKEEGCAVRQGVRSGQINKKRYISFKEIYQELNSKKQY